MRRLARLLLVVTASSLLAGALVGCTDDANGGAGEDPTQRLVDIYAAAVEAVVAEARPLPDDGDEPLAVYLEAREDTEISAEVQVGVVDALEPWASVRFIDSLEEAVEVDADGAPVRGDGVLVGLGVVGDGLASTTVMVDRYEGPDRTSVFEVDVVRRRGEWSVDGAPRPTAVDAP